MYSKQNLRFKIEENRQLSLELQTTISAEKRLKLPLLVIKANKKIIPVL